MPIRNIASIAGFYSPLSFIAEPVGANNEEIDMQACDNCGIAVHVAGSCTTCNPGLKHSQDGFPPVWKERFALIERAGGATRADILKLPLKDRFKVNFNIWAFLFGTFYFLATGMWRRAISYTVAVIALSQLIDLVTGGFYTEHPLSHPMNYFGPMFFAYMANVCYYKEKVLGDRGWW